MVQQTIQEKIKQRRRQLLVHSYIYYEMNNNIVSDEKWSKWAKELVELQKQYPEESKQVEYYEAFKDFDGSTGFDLPYDNPEIMFIATNVLFKEKSKSTQNVQINKKQTVKPKSKSKSFF